MSRDERVSNRYKTMAKWTFLKQSSEEICIEDLASTIASDKYGYLTGEMVEYQRFALSGAVYLAGASKVAPGTGIPCITSSHVAELPIAR